MSGDEVQKAIARGEKFTAAQDPFLTTVDVDEEDYLDARKGEEHRPALPPYPPRGQPSPVAEAGEITEGDKRAILSQREEDTAVGLGAHVHVAPPRPKRGRRPQVTDIDAGALPSAMDYGEAQEAAIERDERIPSYGYTPGDLLAEEEAELDAQLQEIKEQTK